MTLFRFETWCSGQRFRSNKCILINYLFVILLALNMTAKAGEINTLQKKCASLGALEVVKIVLLCAWISRILVSVTGTTKELLMVWNVTNMLLNVARVRIRYILYNCKTCLNLSPALALTSGFWFKKFQYHGLNVLFAYLGSRSRSNAINTTCVNLHPS